MQGFSLQVLCRTSQCPAPFLLPAAKHTPGTFPLNITVAQLSFSFFRTKTMFPGRTCSSSAVSGMNSNRTRCGWPWRALGAGAEGRSGRWVMWLLYFVGGTFYLLVSIIHSPEFWVLAEISASVVHDEVGPGCLVKQHCPSFIQLT